MLLWKHAGTGGMSGYVFITTAACSLFSYSVFSLTTGGKMVQIGLNMGPRHCRILGWAKSFTRKLTKETRVQKDADLIGAMSILWSVVKSNIPSDISDHVQAILDGEFPTLASRDIPEGLPVFCFTDPCSLLIQSRAWVRNRDLGENILFFHNGSCPTRGHRNTGLRSVSNVALTIQKSIQI